MHPRWLAHATAVTVVALAGCATSSRVEPTSAPVCTTAKSEAEANKALVARFSDEVWAKRNPDAALSGVLAADLVNHAAIPEAQGAEGLRTISRKVLAAFPDLTMKRLDVVAEGDRVVERVLFEGTQTGALEFKQPVPATGKHVRMEQVHTYRIRDGKIVEMWMTMDHLDFMKQLGLVPPPKNPT
jgi:predicted ester cyclase